MNTEGTIYEYWEYYIIILQYLGSTRVRTLQGNESTKESITRMKVCSFIFSPNINVVFPLLYSIDHLFFCLLSYPLLCCHRLFCLKSPLLSLSSNNSHRVYPPFSLDGAAPILSTLCLSLDECIVTFQRMGLYWAGDIVEKWC